MRELKLQRIKTIPAQPEPVPGPPGARGKAGSVGPIGPHGIDGKVGSTGPTGPIGPQGKEGRRGARGLQGIPGAKGKDGKPGERGERGQVGEKGLTGERGAKGEQGIQGKEGTQGPKGDKGDMPNHRWIGTKLQFQTSSGKWGKLVELKGPPGPRGGGLSLLGTVVNQAASDESVEYLTRYDQVGETIAYIGQALPGTANNAATWRIKLLTTQTDGDLSVEWADGTSEFTKVWDNRAGYTYS